MDSGNSGSMQSSSGADEEYDSRFFNHPPPPQQNHIVGSFSNHLPHNLFDPLSNYLDPTQRLSLNHDNITWSNTRSEPNQSDLLPQNQNFLSTQPIPFPVSPSNDQDHKTTTNMKMVRNPKKRTRASRRAPTTILTTDTTNFRAMVQEFTGIPTQPFTSSPFKTTRLDLFGSITTSSSPTPFAQKVQPIVHPFPPSTCSIPSSTFPQLSLNNMHNPIFNFQAQTTPRYPLGNSSIFASKTQQPSLGISQNCCDESHLKMGVLEELGLKNMVPSLSLQRISTITNNDGDHGGERNIQVKESNNGKVNYSASTSELHGEIKGQDCAVVARCEGMVESWINCSSD